MQYAALKLPQKSYAEQRQSKASWNLSHSNGKSDFYTTGYAGRDIKSFTDILKSVGVATLVDIRHLPVSRFKPDFSKNNLKKSLESNGIMYIHRPDWGVPREIRANSVGKATRKDIWKWYDSNVLSRVVKKNVHIFFNSMEHPVVFMCVEYDPTECHRHRLFLGLERLGLGGHDL